MKTKEVYSSPKCESFEVDTHSVMVVSAKYNGFNNTGGEEDAEW